MENFTEENLIQNCPHCDLQSFAYKYPLEVTENFVVVCDGHPLEEGHILIIPKKHLSCVGEFSDIFYEEFIFLYQKYYQVLIKNYGVVASFEHGKIGQTVFHSHVHLLPFNGNIVDIIPEGESFIHQIEGLKNLKQEFQQKGQYLFFSLSERCFLVDTSLGKPRFFRDRFANALGNSERGNWKNMHNNKELMDIAQREIISLMSKI